MNRQVRDIEVMIGRLQEMQYRLSKHSALPEEALPLEDAYKSIEDAHKRICHEWYDDTNH